MMVPKPEIMRANNGLSAVRHMVALVSIVVAGIVSVTLLYSQVSATDVDTKVNTARIEHLEKAYQSIKTQQQVIIQQIESEEGNNREFRARTDRSLERILERLPARTGREGYRGGN